MSRRRSLSKSDRKSIFWLAGDFDACIHRIFTMRLKSDAVEETLFMAVTIRAVFSMKYIEEVIQIFLTFVSHLFVTN